MGKRTELKHADPEKLLEKLPAAILNGASVQSAGKQCGLSQVNARALAAAIQTPIEEFNAKLSTGLEGAIELYLDKIKAAANEMPAASLAYTFAVLVDKRTALTGRTNPAGAAVNVQINNNGLQMGKDELISLLEGKTRPASPPIDTAPDASP